MACGVKYCILDPDRPCRIFGVGLTACKLKRTFGTASFRLNIKQISITIIQQREFMRVDQRDEISDMVDTLGRMLRRLDETGETIAALRVSEAMEALQASKSCQSTAKKQQAGSGVR